MFADIFPHLDQVIGKAHLQDVLGLFLRDKPGIAAMLRQGPGHIVKGQAGLHGSADFAGNAQMIVLVAAEAGAHAHILRLIDNVLRPLVVQDVVGLIREKHRFPDKYPGKLRIHIQEKVLDEVLLHIDILVEQFA